jgi:hypothetical protein
MSEVETSAESTETATTGESTESATGQQQTSTETAFDPKSLSPEAQAYLKAQMEAAGFKARDNARTKAAEEARAAVLAEFAEKLGLAGEGEAPSAEELSGHLEQAQAKAFQTGVELQLTRAATRLGGDVEAMLDSNRFMDDFLGVMDGDNDDVGNMDPRSREFAAAVEAAAAKALEKNPRFKAATGSTGPRPDPSQGARGSGPDIDSRIAEAKKNKDFRTVIALENQKLKIQ